ncbi:ARM repeat-containing protein [Trichoderma evansii]
MAMKRAVDWRKLPVSLTELCIDTTLRCGQSFRWRKLNDEWLQDETHLHYKVTWPEHQGERSSPGSSSKDLPPRKDDTENLLRHYFSLDIDLASLYQQWSKDDPNFRKKAPKFTGVHKLCKHYGPFIGHIDGEAMHDFPTPESLNEKKVETHLRELGFGYRAKYIAETARIIAQDKPSAWLDSLRNPEFPAFNAVAVVDGPQSTYKDAQSALLSLTGVGPKVADCVCLMGLGWGESVPVDTHVLQIAQRDYRFGKKGPKTINKAMYDAIGDHFRSIWGKYAGWAHSVLFTADLREFSGRMKEEKVEEPSVKEETPASEGKSKRKRKTSVEIGKRVHVKKEEDTKENQERNAAAASTKSSRALAASNQRNDSTKQRLTDSADNDLYDRQEANKFAGYHTSLPMGDDDEMEEGDNTRRLVGQYTASRDIIDEFARGDGVEEDDILAGKGEKSNRITDRETDYQKRRFNRVLTPTRADPFAENRQAGAAENGTSYREIMEIRELEREEERVMRAIQSKSADGDNDDEPRPTLVDHDKENAEAGSTEAVTSVRKRKKRWDVSSTPAEEEESKDENDTATKPKRSRWDQTPAVSGPGAMEAPKKRSRWDQAPSATPMGNQGLATPMHQPQTVAMPTTFGTDISGRNMPLSDEELDLLLPGENEGYKILEPPPGYEPVRAPTHKLMATPAPQTGFTMQDPDQVGLGGKPMPAEIPGVGDLQFFKPEDMAYFGKLTDGSDENALSVDELKERKIMRLLLKIKNGTPPMRKTALRQITDNARQFGAGALFDQILPLLMEKTLEDQERHLLVKVIDRILYKLDDLVRPYVHKILVVIEPLLIDQDYYARVEGREIISNLSKAAGLATMISTMRPDIDHVDEYVRNTTARAFAVVASALGIPALLPFLRAVCRSKKSWQARHTGVKIVQQIPILMGCAVLPHLKGLVDCIAPNLSDDQTKVRTVTSLAIAALAEASNPYGIESFDDILNPLWTGARKQRGKGLAGFLKAVGYIIPLMDEEYANYYTSQIMEILLREFSSPDEEMKKVVLKVVSQCAGTEGVTAGYLKEHVLDEFFKSFWVRRMALDKRNYRQVVETTVDIGQKVGVSEIIERIVNNLKDESEAYRKMTVETVEKIVASLGAADIGERLEERLIDGILHAFQEQSVEDIVMLNGFGSVVNALGARCKPYLPQIVSTILWRLNNKSATVRQQAADLISRIAMVMKQCGEDALMGKLGIVLYEYLGEEYPEVLGSILGALRSIVTVVGISQMQPPIKDLLPRLTPILRNRHEKVQENTIDLVGRIADRGPESVNAREWMRICFELLDMLKAHKKGIRRAANNTFGFIAKAIGPQDVLATLLNNLRVQERQSRVNTAVAIGIVAETCAPFTVLPALMNEYRVPELNVQNGYIGEMAKDYVYAVTPLLEDALTDRDQVHRQTAASVVKHIALGVVGLGCEDAMIHLLNLLYPNLFETSPHAIRVAAGPGLVMNYVWAGLFHPARKVRTPYWRLYNDAYVAAADSMVPYYPNLDDDTLDRPELAIIL